MKQDIQWFTDRIGKSVIRTAKDGHQVNFEISEYNAKYLSELAESGFKFTEGQVESGVRVHEGPPDAKCVGCES